MSRSPSIFEQRRTRPAADAKFWTPLQTLVVVAAQEPSPLKPPQSGCGVMDVSSAAFVSVVIARSVMSRLASAISRLSRPLKYSSFARARLLELFSCLLCPWLVGSSLARVVVLADAYGLMVKERVHIVVIPSGKR